MFQPLLQTRLRTGELVSAAVIHAPDLEWASRLESLLAHKGDPWNWQNSELLRESTGANAKFYVLHREGRPFSNIMLVESAGVALLGHVWTDPADRGAGASGNLMELLLSGFRAGRDKAIILGTEADSEPFRYYARRGFVPVEPGSGYMMLTKGSPEEFHANWFEGETGAVEALDWKHWAAAAPLCLGDHPQTIRLAATGLIGRMSSEGALLPVIRRQRQLRAHGGPDCAVALATPTGAVVGFASVLPDPIWPEQDVLDLFVHPSAWSRATELIDKLPLQSGRSCVAYTDIGGTSKVEILAATGFSRVAVLPDWLPGRGDVTVWRRV